jgi:hypothetical protein
MPPTWANHKPGQEMEQPGLKVPIMPPTWANSFVCKELRRETEDSDYAPDMRNCRRIEDLTR